MLHSAVVHRRLLPRRGHTSFGDGARHPQPTEWGVGRVERMGCLLQKLRHGSVFPNEKMRQSQVGNLRLSLKLDIKVRGCSFSCYDCFSPAYGGSDCFGLPEEWRLCSTNPCPPPLGDIRAEQCARLPAIIDFTNSSKSGMQWLPYESEEREYFSSPSTQLPTIHPSR